MAADFNKPAVADNHATGYTPAIVDNLKALAQGLDPTVVSPANVPTNAIRWNNSNKYWERYNGTSWSALAATYGISITGNAATATKWTTGRTIALTGDVTGTSAAFDGSGNLSFAGTLATVNANVGSFGGGATAVTVTVDGKGRIIGISNATISIAWSQITSGKPTTVSGYGITDAITTANIGGQSVNYATSAGSAPANGGTASYSTYLWSTSHGGSYYISNAWDGAYWNLTSNHGAGVRVARADTAGSAPASDVYSWAKAAAKPSYSAAEVGAAAVSHTHSYVGADVGALSVGCFALLTRLAGDFVQGATYAGSELYPSSLYSGGQTQIVGNYYTATACSGTWRAMSSSATNVARIGIFQRIS